MNIHKQNLHNSIYDNMIIMEDIVWHQCDDLQILIINVLANDDPYVLRQHKSAKINAEYWIKYLQKYKPELGKFVVCYDVEVKLAPNVISINVPKYSAEKTKFLIMSPNIKPMKHVKLQPINIGIITIKVNNMVVEINTEYENIFSFSVPTSNISLVLYTTVKEIVVYIGEIWGLGIGDHLALSPAGYAARGLGP